VLSLEAAVSSSLSLSHTISEIWVGDMNLRLLGSLMAVDAEQVASHDLRVQPGNRLFFLQRSYSFGLRFNPAV
jgi:hypothetical protein